VLLLDEPFDGLDPAALEAQAGLLRAQAGRSILMATHRFGLAGRLADRALILQRGIVADEVPLREAAPGTLALRYAAVTEAAG